MPPTDTEAPNGDTTIVPTGSIRCTLTVAVPERPSDVAVMVVVPLAIPLTTPLALIVATAGFDDVSVVARAINGLPRASKVVTES